MFVSFSYIQQLDLLSSQTVEKQADRNVEREFTSFAIDAIGIVIDIVYRLITTLFYGASVLRTIKGVFYILNFIGR